METISKEIRDKVLTDILMKNVNAKDVMIMREIFALLPRHSGVIKVNRMKDIPRNQVMEILRLLYMFDAIEYSSLGMKGTFIRVLNTQLIERVGEVAEYQKLEEEEK